VRVRAMHAGGEVMFFIVVEHHTKLLGTSRRIPKPGDTWDDMSGTVHASKPDGRRRTLCGRLIIGERSGWFVGDNTDEAGRVTCRRCHSALRARGEE
jgi:hypothetical protein